jgi:Bacterial membrane protein YfhO
MPPSADPSTPPSPTRDPAAPPQTAPAAGRRRPGALGLVSFLAVVLFALWGIGGPLVGTSVGASTASMVGTDPYSQAGFAGTPTDNTMLQDVYTAELPSTIVFTKLVGENSSGQWNPYISGGTALAAVPVDALYSPFTVAYYLLPTWLAPAYEHLLEIICSIGATFLFLRRLGLARAPALTGGMVFAGSGFMVLWLGFPQTRVAAFIPVLFWGLECFLQERRVRDVALIAVAVAALLLGGFPSVTGYALLTGAAYLIVRAIADHRRSMGRLVRVVAGAAAGLAAGLALAAIQLLPFIDFFRTWFIEGRNQTGGAHLAPINLVTMVAPWAFGTVNPGQDPQWVLSTNMVEAGSYLGAAALVLVLVAVALARRGRALLPTGAWWFLLAAAAVWAELIYLGSLPLIALQDVPGLRGLFGENFIGRGRSVLGFLLAALAGVGFELLLRRRAENAAGAAAGAVAGTAAGTAAGSAGDGPEPGPRRALRRRAWPGLVAAAAAAVGAVLLVRGGHAASDAARAARKAGHLNMAGASSNYVEQTLIGGALVLVALLCVAALWRGGRVGARGGPPRFAPGSRAARISRFGAAALLPVLVAGQGLSFVRPYNPTSAENTFYPVTDTQSYLAANLGAQRYANTTGAMTFSINTAYQLRSVGGHTFINDAFAQLVRGMPDDPVPYSSYITFGDNLAQATSPILDVLGTKYFVAGLGDPVFGPVTADAGDGTSLTLQPGRPQTFTVPVTGRLRAVGFTPHGRVPASVSAADPDSWVQVTVEDAVGHQVASTRRITQGMVPGVPFELPVAADQEPAGTKLTATLTLHTPAPVAVVADGGALAATAVAGADDGLLLTHVGTSVFYQRLNALPRIRWASASEVVTDQAARVSMLAGGSVPADTVVLSAPGPKASGAPASVRVDQDGSEEVSATVNASGGGYLVVADADQVGWAAAVDGRAAPLVAADQGVVAVAVPAGVHTVSLRYAAPYDNAGTWITAAAGVVLTAGVLAEWWWLRRRRGAATG